MFRAALLALLLAAGACGRARGPEARLELPPAAADTGEVAARLLTRRGPVEALYHPAPGARAAVVMVGGARGGTGGPGGVYAPLARRFQGQGVAALRVAYRRPNRLGECTEDVLAAVRALRESGVDRVVLLGWSFGGAVVIRAGARSPDVVGVGTFASQTYGAAGEVAKLAPRSLLLFHGTRDPVLSDGNSRLLYETAGEPRDLVLYPGEGHAFTRVGPDLARRVLAWALPLLRPRAH